MSVLQDFKDNLSRAAHGMTSKEAQEKGICVHCKNPPVFNTDLGKVEYKISGLCEDCFREITTDPETDYDY